jgi:crossover junction endodeoxyribonuclease RuvC
VVARRAGRLAAVAHGTIRTPARAPHPERLALLHEGVAALVAAHPVREAALESWFVHPVSRSAMAVAEARGAILAALARSGVAIREYAPTEVKQAVTGQGRADKRQVRAMVTRLAGTEPGSDHAADALAVAICHLHVAPLARAVGRASASGSADTLGS